MNELFGALINCLCISLFSRHLRYFFLDLSKPFIVTQTHNYHDLPQLSIYLQLILSVSL